MIGGNFGKHQFMAILRLAPHLTVAQLRERMNAEPEVRFFRKWQIWNAVASESGIRARDLALMLGTSVDTVCRTVQLYNKVGAEFTGWLQWGGRREQHCVMNLNEEKALLQEAEGGALRGEVLVAKHLRLQVEQKVGRPVSEDYL